MAQEETKTVVTAKDANGKDVATTSTTSGAAQSITVLKAPDGTEVTTTVKSHNAAQDGLADHDQVVAIWSKAVDTQMHFNEMSVKSRQLGLTFVAAALGLAVVLMSHQRDYRISVSQDIDLHVAVLLVLAAAGAMYVVSILDLGVYHRMLRGAVAFGDELEELRLKPLLGVERGMTQAIAFFSRDPKARFNIGSAPHYQASGKQVTAEDKIRRFYRSTIIVLLLVASFVFFVTCKPLEKTTANPTSSARQGMPTGAQNPTKSSGTKTAP